MRIAIDLDNVAVEWQYHWMVLYNQWFGTELTKADGDSWDACTTKTHFNSMDEFYRWFESADGWKTQPFVPGAQGFLYNLDRICKDSAGIHSYLFVTSRPTPAGKLAAKDLAASLYGSQVAFADDNSKQQQNADIWIDDSPAVLASLEQAGKKSIRFNRPWNSVRYVNGFPLEGVSDAPSTYSADNWQQVMDILVHEEGILQ